MGKSVQPKKDPFAYNPEYNSMVGGAAPPIVPGANDAFTFKPEYNADVKKKIGGTASETGITEPSPTASESQSKKETATSFLINDINQNDFFSDLAAQTDRYFPHTTPQRVNEQAAEMTQKEVFRNPGSLQKYTADRLSKLREDIKNIEREKFQLKDFTYSDPLSSFEGGSIVDQKKYDQLAQQAREKEKYINDFKDNVADVAADLIMSQQDLTKFDPRRVGREIVRIADPEQEKVFAIAEDGGKSLPLIKREEMERIGINALKQYLSRHPDIPNYDQVVGMVNSLEGDFDERNFQLTGQRVREKIGAQIYKEGRGSFFGFGYKPSTLQDVAENPNTGLTESEKKIFKDYVLPIERRLIGTNIPTSGFTRSFFNAVEKGAVNAGKSLGDVTGIRDESDQAQDILNREVEESGFRAAGEGPTPQAQLSYLQQKEKKEPLNDKEKALKKELENYTYVRNGWSKFKDGVGDLTGQVAMIAMTTKGLGAAGKALTASGEAGGLLGGLTRSALGTALSNETVGLFVSSYMNAYDNYKQQAIEMMPGKDQAANRDAYATVMSAVEGLSERIFRDTKILNAFTKNVSPAIRTITDKFISREITQQVAREETEKALTSALKSFGKEYTKATGQESTEEAVVDIANGVANAVFGGQEFDIVKTGQQALNTFLTTALYSPLVSGMSAIGSTRQHRAENSFMKSALVDMAASPAQYLQTVEDLQADGTITQQQANEKIKLIKSASQYLQEIPISREVSETVGEGDAAVEVSEDKSFDYPEVSSYLVHRLNEGILTEKINETTDEVLKSQLQKQLKRSQEIRKGLFDGSISVTPDLREVTDNPEEAAELGIFDAAKLPADDLIGTPFERGTENVPRETEKQTNEEEPENQDTTATPAAGEAASAQNQTAEAPQINEEQKTELMNRAAEAAQTEMNPDYAAVFTKDVETGLREAAQQLNATGSEAKTARELYGPTISDIAMRLFPDEKPPEMSSEMEASLLEDDDSEVDFPTQKIETNENEIDQEASTASKEANAEESGTQEGGEKTSVLKKQGAAPVAEAPLSEEKTVAKKGKELADKIRSLKIKNDVARSDIFGIGTSLYNGAIEAVAIAIEQGARLINSINKGIKYIREKGGENLDEKAFREFLKDIVVKEGENKIVYEVGDNVEVEEETMQYSKAHQIIIRVNGVGEIVLGKEKRDRNYKVDYVEVDKSLRGKGKAKKLYYEAIKLLNERGLFLEPGGYSAPRAVSVWKRLEKEGLATIESIVEGGEEPGHFIIKGKTTGKSPVNKSLSEKGKDLADKIRSLKTKRDKAQANIFGIGIGIYDGAIETIATAIEQGAALVDAINLGIQYIRDNGGDQLDEENFRQHIEDQASGKKPKIKVQVGEEEAEEKPTPRPKKERKEAQPEDVESGIEDYKMTSSGDVNRFLSGATWADVFGEAPEGNQQYETQKLADMLQDGQNMIAIAQRKWGNDVMMYAKPLFQFIQGLNDNETTNKKAVLLAVLLGELQEAKMRSPERFDAISQIEKAVFAYYQSFMNQRGKEIVAGRLLRLYRDKYLGDIYTDKILDEDQVRAKKKMQAAEENKNIDDTVAAESAPPVTKEEKKKDDADAKKKTEKAKKDRSKKTKMSATEAQQKADSKLKDIEDRLGKEGKGGLIDKIKEAIKKLNCK